MSAIVNDYINVRRSVCNNNSIILLKVRSTKRPIILYTAVIKAIHNIVGFSVITKCLAKT